MTRIAKIQKTTIQSLALIAALSLAACSSAPKNEPHRLVFKHPTSGKKDPSDRVLIDAIQQYVDDRNAPANTRFEYVRVDLNEDGRRDALVMMKLPYSFWCKETGCRTVVFRADNTKFEVMSELTLVRGPILISETRTNDWKDIIIREDGRLSDARHVLMQHNGASYPSYTDRQPTFTLYQEFKGNRVLP